MKIRIPRVVWLVLNTVDGKLYRFYSFFSFVHYCVFGPYRMVDHDCSCHAHVTKVWCLHHFFAFRLVCISFHVRSVLDVAFCCCIAVVLHVNYVVWMSRASHVRSVLSSLHGIMFLWCMWGCMLYFSCSMLHLSWFVHACNFMVQSHCAG